MRSKFYLGLTALAALLVAGCKAPNVVDSSYAYNDFRTVCLSTDLDGSYTVRAWGKGKNRVQAIEQARKNAARDIIFKGITTGNPEFHKRPIVTEVNANEKYERYFNTFFADNGPYKQYTSLGDEKQFSRQKSSNNTIENWGIVVRVNYDGLRQQLTDDGILKQ